MLSDTKTESIQKTSHTAELYNAAYRQIENYLRFIPRARPDFSNMKLRWKLIICLKAILGKMGFNVEFDGIWDAHLRYSYELSAKNREAALGTTLYGLTNLTRLDDVYSMLTDDQSREVFDWFLQYRLAYIAAGPIAADIFPYLDFERNNNLKLIKKKQKIGEINGYVINCGDNWHEIENTWINEQYLYSGKCAPQKGEVVIDAGGFLGETAIWFADKVGASGKVYSFEPSEDNFRKMITNIQSNKLEMIISGINLGLWDGITDLFITDYGPASYCAVKQGGAKIKATTLDEYVQTERIARVDFIKMDIEGAELHALKGAARTILKFKPKLALSIYHLPEDIYEIPFFIKSLVPQYRLYLSHKYNGWHETILFAAVD